MHSLLRLPFEKLPGRQATASPLPHVWPGGQSSSRWTVTLRAYERSKATLVFACASDAAVPLAAALYLLELFIAFVQAFIFTLLSALFINMVAHPDH